MATFKKVRLASNLGPYTFYTLVGLPEGESCNVSPEDDSRPRGGWFIAIKRRGRKAVRRFASLKAAKAAALEWAKGSPAKKKRATAKR